MAKILIVDDDEDLAQVLSHLLVMDMHTVDVARDGAEGLSLLQLSQYDVVILDWNLPKMDGVQVCREYRSRGGNARVLMLTGRSDVTDKVKGLDFGADDYLIKPFDSRELSARVRVLLRRPLEARQDVLAMGSLSLDTQNHTVSASGKSLQMAPREFALLEFFMRNPDQVFSVDSLLARVWRVDSEAAQDAVRMSIKRLREKLAENEGCPEIETIYGVGYKLKLKQE